MHNEGLHNLSSTPNFIRMPKLMMMRWAEQKQAVSKLSLPPASAAHLLVLLFYLENEDDTFLQNIRLSANHTVLQTGRCYVPNCV